MTRVDTRSPRDVSIKISKNSANLCRLITAISIAALVAITYFVVSKPAGSLGDPSDQYVVKNIPKIYTRLETIDPEERDVFQGFRTSFLPHDEIILTRKNGKGKKEMHEGNVTSDIFIWGVLETENNAPTRVKRMSNFTFTARDPTNENDSQLRHLDESGDNYDDQNESIHAFWKGQGDKETIRNTQANIMKQYMDAEADPCHDFYQYACGNWPALNPIPADKAGYDTFEMLRENLDTVLKELLEFKNEENITSMYPGAHLDIVDNFLNLDIPSFDLYQDPNEKKSKDEANATWEDFHYHYLRGTKDNTELVQRIRRYLDKKSKIIVKPITQIKTKVHRYITERRKLMRQRVKRSVNSNHNTRRKKVARSNNVIETKEIRYGRRLQMYNVVKRKRQEREANLFEDQSNHETANGDAAMKARFLFKSCMNYNILQKRSHQPLLDLLDHFGGWPILKENWDSSNFNWLELMARLRLYNNDILISEWVGPDIKNSDEFVIQFDQTSLGLPTRDYFLQDSNTAYLSAYRTYLVKIAQLLGGDPVKVERSASELIEFEIK
ncbi:Endothelin-converting enzyme 1 [Operophtera brumata]|uniref:Endothelin-converting enzyme 1 n=1 Tax=Operophtera brumata TaxID=104452 RepID=A0A0L7L3W6_OPEBR|nr:Endothelin-converting enzyme 1 [Operophtera brumata]